MENAIFTVKDPYGERKHDKQDWFQKHEENTHLGHLNVQFNSSQKIANPFFSSAKCVLNIILGTTEVQNERKYDLCIERAYSLTVVQEVCTKSYMINANHAIGFQTKKSHQCYKTS